MYKVRKVKNRKSKSNGIMVSIILTGFGNKGRRLNKNLYCLLYFIYLKKYSHKNEMYIMKKYEKYDMI